MFAPVGKLNEPELCVSCRAPSNCTIFMMPAFTVLNPAVVVVPVISK